MKTITTHTNANGIAYYSTTDENGQTIYSFTEDFEDIWTQEDQDYHDSIAAEQAQPKNTTMKTNTYQIRFNRSTFTATTIEEAESQAMDLIDASCPFEAKIVEVDEAGEFLRTVKTLGPANATSTIK